MVLRDDDLNSKEENSAAEERTGSSKCGKVYRSSLKIVQEHKV